MKRAALVVLCLSFVVAVATTPALAQTLYSNVGPNTDTGIPLAAYGVYNGDQDTTDSFTLGSSATVTSANLILWAYADYSGGSTQQTGWDVNYSIGTSPFGSQIWTGTAVTPTSSDYINTLYDGPPDPSYQFNLYSVTIPVPSVDLGPGTYWVTLAGTTNNQDFYAFWDASWPASEGPSTAYFGNKTSSTVPSETFELFGPSGPTPTAVPEANPFDLPVVVGALAIVFLFRKRIATGGISRSNRVQRLIVKG